MITLLPDGIYGTTSTATTASSLLASLPQIRIGLLVGIGGAIARPDQDYDIRLGDVVLSKPDGIAGGVIQYDLGNAKSNPKWERKGSLSNPPQVLLNALEKLRVKHERAPLTIPSLLEAMWEANPRMKITRKKEPGLSIKDLKTTGCSSQSSIMLEDVIAPPVTN